MTPFSKFSASQAKAFYADFVQGLRTTYAVDKVKDGEFGAMMDVALVNDVSAASCSGRSKTCAYLKHKI